MDRDLERAIAASLADQQAIRLQPNVIDISSGDDEDDDLDAPVSTRHSRNAKDLLPSTGPLRGNVGPAAGHLSVLENGPGSALTPAEAQLNERRERMKRKAADEELRGDSVKRSPSKSLVSASNAGIPGISLPDPISLAEPLSSVSTTGSSKIKIAYPNGALRITRTPGRQNAKNCVNLKDVIHKHHLVTACVFSFFIADPELFQHLPLSHSSDAVPIYVGRDPNQDETVISACREAGTEIQGKVTRQQLLTMGPVLRQLNSQANGTNFHAFYAWSSGSSHSKILILVYHDFMRIVITSCNMMDIDTLQGDNHWYIHDLPKLPSRSRGKPSLFETDLLAHLRDLQTPDTFLNYIQGMYDYSQVKVHLVTSVPGVCSGPRAEDHGLLRLRRVVRELDLNLPRKENEGGELRLEVCAASIGNLSIKWLNAFHDCALGMETIKVASESSSMPEMKLFYPTVGDVKGAYEAAQHAASNIGCHTRPWNTAPEAIKKIFHHYESKDNGRLFHQKLIMAYNAKHTSSPPYYVYVGSANLSASAWGAIEQDNRKNANEATCKTKLTKLTNFECGVVVPGHLIMSLLEPGTKSWQEGIVPYNQTAKPYDLRVDRAWNDPRWVQDYQEDWQGVLG